MTKTQSNICLLTSGLGRLKPKGAGPRLNPSLFPVESKAVISHFIERLEPLEQFRVAVTDGEWGRQVRDYLSLAHPSKRFEFQAFAAGASFPADSKHVIVDADTLGHARSAGSDTFDFSKSEESLFFIADRVIKYFEDEQIAALRVKRAGLLPEVFPPILKRAGQFYAYQFQEGQTLYQCLDGQRFDALLAWAEQMIWQPINVAKNRAQEAAARFYEEKTKRRLAQYLEKHGITDGPSTINGVSVPATAELLKKVPWNALRECSPVFMHGDFQLDNILYDDARDKFVLLDWRQEFGGESEFGDLYYDFAKLYASIWVDYNQIKSNCFSYEERDGVVRTRFDSVENHASYLKALERFVDAKGLSFKKVKWLAALVYLNMAPLHRESFDKLLYSLGRELLAYNSAACRLD